MKRSKMLLAAVASGAVLSAAAVPTALAMTGPKTQTTTQAKPGNSNNASNPGNGQQCGYPSNRTPSATLAANPTSVKAGRTTTLSGVLSSNKCPIANTPVSLYSKVGNGPLTKGPTVLTSATGAFTFPAQTPAATTTYVAISTATEFYDSVSSNPVTVTVTK